MKITIKVKTTGEEQLAKLQAALGDGTVGNALKTAALAEVQDNFALLGQKPNKLGGTSTGYWKAAWDSTTSKINGPSVVVTISHLGVALHYYGGTVKPSGKVSEVTGKPIKFLTIPKVAAAHGKTVGTLRAMGITLYPGRGGLLRQAGAKREPKTDEMWFALTKSVTFKPDPTVLPTEAKLRAAGITAIDNLLSFTASGNPPEKAA